MRKPAGLADPWPLGAAFGVATMLSPAFGVATTLLPPFGVADTLFDRLQSSSFVRNRSLNG